MKGIPEATAHADGLIINVSFLRQGWGEVQCINDRIPRGHWWKHSYRCRRYGTSICRYTRMYSLSTGIWLKAWAREVAPLQHVLPFILQGEMPLHQWRIHSKMAVSNKAERQASVSCCEADGECCPVFHSAHLASRRESNFWDCSQTRSQFLQG